MLDTTMNLDSMVSFPLYASAKAMVSSYKPFLDDYNLTFTQYLTMLVLWDKENLRVKDLGSILHLDSGTLTPLLKKLTAKGYINRAHGQRDEREVFLTLTEEGQALKDKLRDLPEKSAACFNISAEEFSQLYTLLSKILKNLEDANSKNI